MRLPSCKISKPIESLNLQKASQDHGHRKMNFKKIIPKIRYHSLNAEMHGLTQIFLFVQDRIVLFIYKMLDLMYKTLQNQE